jgi:phage-related protein
MALQQVGSQMASFGKEAVSSAITAQTEWGRLNSNLGYSGEAFRKQQDEVKSWSTEFSNSMGRTVGDTRDAENALASYGMKWNEIKASMPAIASLAAGTGKSEAEASKMVTSALAGRGQALKKYGIDVSNYKDKVTGAIDKQRLFNDINAKFKGAKLEYADSDAAAMNRLTNAMNKFKTAVGKGILAILEPLIPAFQAVGNVLSSLPAPVTGAMGAIVLLVGGLAMIGGTIMMLEPVITLLAGGFSIFGTTVNLALGPVLLIVIALAAVAIAVYEVGKYFGWWHDLPSMFSSIQAGLQRLWSAFTNNPHVKELIKDLQEAFKQLSQALSPVVSAVSSAWNALTSALGAGSGSDVDAVRAIIDIIGLLGEVILAPIMAAITTISLFINAVQRIYTFFVNLPATVNKGVVAIRRFFTQILLLARVRVNLFIAVLRRAFIRIPLMLGQYLTQTLHRIITWAVQMAIRGRQAGQRLVNGVITFVRQLPQEIAQWLQQVVGRILGFIGQFFSAGNQDGQNLFNGVKGMVTQIPNMVYSEFKGIAQRVISVGGELYNAAKQVGQKLWDGIQSVMQHHSPGRFMKLTDAEFGGIADVVNASSGKGYDSARRYAQQLSKGFGNPQLKAKAKMDTIRNINTNVAGKKGKSSGGVVYNIHIGSQSFDLANLSEKQARKVVNLALKGEGSKTL